MKSIYILVAIFLLVNCEQITTTDETTYAYFNFIKDAYNQQNPRRIYNLFSQVSKDNLSYEIFQKQIQEIFDRSGKIIYWTHKSVNADNPQFSLGFEKNLAAGVLIWTYSEKYFLRFAIVDFAKPTMVDYFLRNQNKVTFTAISDGQKLIDYFGDRDQDLMSVFKITVAMEFARQASEKVFDIDQLVSLDEINKFFIKSIDISHQQFLDIWQVSGLIVDNKMKLQDVVKGMIAFSSNSCTEYLQQLLTLKSIQELVDTVKLHQTQAYYLASYQLSYLNLNNLPDDEYIKEIDSLTSEQVLIRSNDIHNILVTGSKEATDLLERGKELLNPKVLAIQTKQFTRSNTNSYAKLMDQLNNQQLFNQGFYDIFYPLIGIVELSNQSLKKLYVHVGAKGGSSAIQDDTECVFSFTQFSELQNELPYKKISYALFMEGLFWNDYQSVIVGFDDFKTLISTNGLYLNAVAQKLNNIS